MTVAPQQVIDAWADIASWVQGTLPGLAMEQTLPNDVYDAGDIGACDALNSPDGSESGAIWGSDGDATITLSSLQIVTMAGVASQAANAPDATTVNLPLSFGTLQINGTYNYTQPCAMYDMGKKASTTSTNGDGAITQTINDNSMYYVASCGDTVTLTGVVVNGTPSVSVNPDTGGLPSWLVAIGNFFSTFNEAQVLQSNLQNVFMTASFSQTMLGLLNQQVGG
jgi:hypothetical protein